ncbi:MULTISPECIES: UbiA family prenyltransferase [Subtercola]|uniref:1,4-dihydroxy-2-naphthoate prenyltransferase n=1 Tax=Subtercola vilae TaxID=2056433 RepID=A0A4T2BWX2_9MICO|nr:MULTISPECIES: UbiA family prenyltransferase [Subtercola]MEA9986749.1 UbiA family prenyltransferase [Subtercola sp. RTI3]TIH34356.1 1,4-dihydroxy-2-naphthoate prenyltransferase [Subtercola vilae]
MPSDRRFGAVASALVAACHPGPTAAVTLLAVVLGIATGLSPLGVLLVAAAILAGQLAIGWSNDWLDARRDIEVGRTDKPVATGAISASTVRTAFIVSAMAVVALSLLLGPPAAVASIVLAVSGLSYNVLFKKTALSGLPYVVSFGLLPLVVTLAAPGAPIAAWWVVATGSLLGLGAHFANVLPDLADDAATGVRGLPHRMGRTASGLSAFGALLGASALVAFGATLTDPSLPPSVVGLVGFAVGVVLSAVGAWLVLTKPPGRLLFQLIIASALVDVLLLALSGSRVIA